MEGYRVGEIPVQHHSRQFGTTKYGWSRIIKGFLDLLTVRFLTGFGQRPQHLLGTIGLVCFFFSGLAVGLLSVWWVISRLNTTTVDDLHLHERAIFYFSIAGMLLGSQFMSIGFLAELVTAYQVRSGDLYSIVERTGHAMETSGEEE